jgi:hypothetical protein
MYKGLLLRQHVVAQGQVHRCFQVAPGVAIVGDDLGGLVAGVQDDGVDFAVGGEVEVDEIAYGSHMIACLDVKWKENYCDVESR